MNVEPLVKNTASKFGISVSAVQTLWEALVRGNGTMAQFNHPELGGSGQWMEGGMTMVGDMFNHGLKSQIDSICNALAFAARDYRASQSIGAYQQQSQFQGVAHNGNTNFASSIGHIKWWPNDLGNPSSTGSQNNLQYAYFAGSRRLAVNRSDEVTIYDTLNHSITGVSQQQGGSDSLTFTSQLGTVRISDLPVVNANERTKPARNANTPDTNKSEVSYVEINPQQPGDHWDRVAETINDPAGISTRVDHPTTDDPISVLERLGKLREAGILTELEFTTKKAELLKRI